MAPVDVLTAAGQLALASEFRFDYWKTGIEHRYYLVKRGRKGNDTKWAITDGEAAFRAYYWDGADWSDDLLGPDAFRWNLEQALVIAKKLAFEENQRVISVMEARFGGYRGGKYDMAVAKEKR